MKYAKIIFSSGTICLLIVAITIAAIISIFKLFIQWFSGYNIFPEFKITFSDAITIIALVAATIILPEIIQSGIDKKSRYRSVLLKESESIREKLTQIKRVIDKLNMDKSSKISKQDKIKIDIQMLEIFNSSDLLIKKSDASKFIYNKKFHDEILDLRDVVSEYLKQNERLNDANYKLISDRVSSCSNNLTEYVYGTLME